MTISKKIYRKTGYFLKEIARSRIVIQAILVGFVAGVLVVLFKVAITEMFVFIQNFISGFSTVKKLLIFPAITTLGGLISGLLVFKIAPETRGSGIPYVKMTLARMGNMTRIRSIVVKFFAGVAGIGTGLSLGREGPSVQLGAGAGALVAKMFKMKGTDQDKLIASGAGAAIGATFNAPIAGAIFVLEELVNKFSASLLFPVLVATVTAASLARYYLGSNPSFIIPFVPMGMTLESIPVCIILGFAAGISGVLFSKIIFINNKLFEKADKIPNWFKPAIAGFAVGIAGIFLPYILGSGNIGVDMLLQHKFSLSMVALIFAAKFFITPFCFGSGAAGGIFLPMLMLGSFLGYLIGAGANLLGLDVNPIVIAMVGMGAFLSAVARTPITAVVMVFEMTGGYNHILPIMLSAAIADLVAEKLGHRPIYSTLIVNQAQKSDEAKLLSDLKVGDYMVRNVNTLSRDVSLGYALKSMDDCGHNAFPVISPKGKLAGIITRADIEDALFQGNSAQTSVEKIMNPSPVTVYADNNLYIAYYRLHSYNTEWLVVTDMNNRIKGIITRKDINSAVKSVQNLS